MQIRALLGIFWGVALAAIAVAQSPPAADKPDVRGKRAPEELPQGLPWSVWYDDPIGLDRSDEGLEKTSVSSQTTGGSKSAADAGLTASAANRVIKVPTGEVLSALSAVRESQHQTSARFAYGLAIITELMRFASLSEVPTEICYRQALPRGARLLSLEACNPQTCRRGFLEGSLSAQKVFDCGQTLDSRREVGPVARAAIRTDTKGEAAIVRAAAVKKGADLTVRLQYLVEAPQYHGVTRLQLPPRGTDDRAAPAKCRTEPFEQRRTASVNTDTSTEVVSYNPWEAAEFIDKSQGAATAAQVWRFSCDGKQCGRVRVASAPKPGAPVDVVLAVDVSPSMREAAQNRVAPAIAFLLAAAPRGTVVRALAFAARATPILDEPSDAQRVPLTLFAKATPQSDSGPTTRFESVWQVAERWFGKRRRTTLHPLIVLVGDGGLTASAINPFIQARRAGVEVSILNLGDRPTTALLRDAAKQTGGIVVEAGAEAEQVIRGRGAQALEDRVAALFAPVVTRTIAVNTGNKVIELGALRAGEEVVWEGIVEVNKLRVTWPGNRIRADNLPKEIAPALGSRIPTTDAKATGPAVPKPGDTKLGAGLPSGPLLSMLRQRIIPVARACFRKDRAGRANYRQRAVFVLRLADQEVTFASVEGTIAKELRQCLLTAVDTLDVPRFYGVVLVRYPLSTEAEPLPEQIELTPEVEQQVDAILGVRPREKIDSNPSGVAKKTL